MIKVPHEITQLWPLNPPQVDLCMHDLVLSNRPPAFCIKMVTWQHSAILFTWN